MQNSFRLSAEDIVMGSTQPYIQRRLISCHKHNRMEKKVVEQNGK